MKRIFAKSTLREFWEKHPDSEQYLKTWYDTAMRADWKTPIGVKRSYATASVLKDSRIVFNIKGNSYRLEVKFNFEHQLAFVRFIGTHLDYDSVDAKLGTSESDELEILGLMVDDYENQHYPIDTPDPIEAIKIRMEKMHLKQVDLIPEIGGKSRVSEILNRKRRLTVDMIRKLAPRLNLSSNVLIKDYQLLKQVRFATTRIGNSPDPPSYSVSCRSLADGLDPQTRKSPTSLPA